MPNRPNNSLSVLESEYVDLYKHQDEDEFKRSVTLQWVPPESSADPMLEIQVSLHSALCGDGVFGFESKAAPGSPIIFPADKGSYVSWAGNAGLGEGWIVTRLSVAKAYGLIHIPV